MSFDILGRSKSDSDVLEIVPDELLQADKHFFEYIVESNNQIGRNQVVGLEKIAAFYRNRNLLERRQAEVRRESLGNNDDIIRHFTFKFIKFYSEGLEVPPCFNDVMLCTAEF